MDQISAQLKDLEHLKATNIHKKINSETSDHQKMMLENNRDTRQNDNKITNGINVNRTSQDLPENNIALKKNSNKDISMDQENMNLGKFKHLSENNFNKSNLDDINNLYIDELDDEGLEYSSDESSRSKGYSSSKKVDNNSNGVNPGDQIGNMKKRGSGSEILDDVESLLLLKKKILKNKLKDNVV